ncbi:MAG: mandelate racemase/muconate lactonizing enzyme family protein [Saonia sp.]
MNRKQFLRGSLMGAAGLGAFGTGKVFANENSVDQTVTDVKIKDIKTYIHKKALFVKIETDAGISGWGEGDHDNTAVVAKAIHKIGKPIVLNQDPFESEYLWHQILYKGEDLGLSGLSTGALAGIDNALWDLKGKLLGVPTYKLLGGCNVEKIKVYGSFGIGEGKKRKTPAQAAEIASDFVARGYDTVKLRMQLRVLNRNPDPDFTEEYVKAVRNAVGDNIHLFVDFNNGYTPGKAVDLIKRLREKYNVVLVEEPVHYHDYDGLRQCVEASSVRIAAGEHEFNRWDFKDLITRGMADVVNLDVIKGGGISEMKKASVLAQTFEREVMFHNARPTLATAATLQLVSTIFNPARIQEWGGERREMGLWPLFENRFTFKDGYIFVPKTSGVGLEVNEKEMEKLLVKD